ncbi:hypothetical protein INR49_021782 [Caranx melampygus]|nr:hypothetical protein INR49_021782 [Caranx melampygus]
MPHAFCSLLCHICERSISIVPEQEVGSVLIVTKHIGQRLTDDGPHHYTSPSCTHRDDEKKLDDS